MIFLGNLEYIEDNKYKVGLRAYDVEERANRRDLTVEEFAIQVLEQKTGLVVEQLPLAEKIEGKRTITCVDLDTQQVYYEYEDIPKTEETEVDILKKQVADLYFVQLQGGTN